MASATPFSEDQPFEEKVKCLADEELLEIWAESQRMESMISMGLPPSGPFNQYCEQTIIHELFIRTGRRLCPPASGR